MTILQCTSLSKHYGRGEELVKALEGVSLSLEQGSFTAITGPSGSGKSTLLHMLGDLPGPQKAASNFGTRTFTGSGMTSWPSSGGGSSALYSRATIWCGS